MKITIRLPKGYGLFGWFGIITDFQIAMRAAVTSFRKTGKPVKVTYSEHYNVTIEVSGD